MKKSGRRSEEDKRHAEKTPDCRCKETEGKTVKEVLKLVLDDLSFWKRKDKKE